MRTHFYHNSPEIFDAPAYKKLCERARSKKYQNRALGLFASTLRVGLDHYGEHQYSFQMALNSTVIETPYKAISRVGSWDYFEGMRRAFMLSGVDALKSKPDPAAADYLLVVLNFDAIDFWERMRWENAFYQGMRPADRTALLEKALTGDLQSLLDAFCPRLAPMGSCFWMDEYQWIDDGKPMRPAAVSALKHALKISRTNS